MGVGGLLANCVLICVSQGRVLRRQGMLFIGFNMWWVLIDGVGLRWTSIPLIDLTTLL